LNIVVCVKQVPDSAARLAVEGGRVTWGDAPLVLNPWDEYAVEAALAEGSGWRCDCHQPGRENARKH
jgi:electron transfer flavoprotein beta subunit